MRLRALFCCTLAFLANHTQANGTTIDFEQFDVHSYFDEIDLPLLIDGYSFTSSLDYGAVILGPSDTTTPNSTNRFMNPWIAGPNEGVVTTIQRVDGGLFDVAKLEADGWDYGAYEATIRLFFVRDRGTTYMSFDLPASRALNILNINQSDVRAFGYFQPGPVAFQLDNIVLTRASISAVPDTSSWLSFVVGFGASGLTMRCRRRLRQAAKLAR